MTTLKQHVARQHSQHSVRRATRRPSPRRSLRESAGDVSVTSALGFDAVSVALPADVNLDDRAARMNQFWEKLVDFQHRDVLVVALAVDGEREYRRKRRDVRYVPDNDQIFAA